MKTMSRRSAVRAIGLLPAAGVCGTAAAVAGTGQPAMPPAAADPRGLAEWHYAELLRLLDELPAGELHVVVQRVRDSET
jgi:hypothetical protein